MCGPAWNTGTCMYMFWTGLGCLVQCVNSIVWNKNIINRAPIYCDIGKFPDALFSESSRSLTFRYPTVTRIQVALNTAVPACTLCINRRLYKIATANAMMTTRSEKRRAIVHDLLICGGLPILQVCARECASAVHLSTSRLQGCDSDYIVSSNRYNIYEDFGPYFGTALTPPTFVLFYAWPVAIGCVSFFYCSECSGLCHRPLVPCLTGHSHDYLHVLQTPSSVQGNVFV
jgi:pheromone a factor receptor